MDVPVSEITVVGEVLPISVDCVGEEVVVDEVVVEDQVVMIDDGSVHYITDIGYQEEEVIDDQALGQGVSEVGEMQAMGEEDEEVVQGSLAPPSVQEEVELVDVPDPPPPQPIEEEVFPSVSETGAGLEESEVSIGQSLVDKFSQDEIAEETVDDSVYMADDERLPEEIMQPESTADEDEVPAVSPAESPAEEVDIDKVEEKEGKEFEKEEEEEEATVDTTTGEDLDSGQCPQDVICVESDSDESRKEEQNGVHSTGKPQEREKPKRVPFENPFESCGSDEDIFLSKPSKKPDTTTTKPESSHSDNASDGAESVENEKVPPKTRVPILESEWLQHHSTMSSQGATAKTTEVRELPKKRWKRRHASTEAKEGVNNGSSDAHTSSPAEELEEPVSIQPTASPQKRGRGRPRKSSLVSPRKSPVSQKQTSKAEEHRVLEDSTDKPASPKKRGRPRKSSVVQPVNKPDSEHGEVQSVSAEPSPLGRGRRVRNIVSQISTDSSDQSDRETSESLRGRKSVNGTPKQTETLNARKRKLSEDDSSKSSPRSTRGIIGKRAKRESSTAEDSAEESHTTQTPQSRTKKSQLKKSQLKSVEGMFARIAEQAAMEAAAGKEGGRSRRLRTRTEPSAPVEELHKDRENPPAPLAKSRPETLARKQTQQQRQRTKSAPLTEKQNQEKSATKKREKKTQSKSSLKKELRAAMEQKTSPPDRRPCYMKINDQLNNRPSGFKSKPGQVFVSGTYICDECSFHTTRQNLIIQHYKDHFRSPSPVAKKKTLSSGKGRGKGKKDSVNTGGLSSIDLDEEDSVDLPAMFTETPTKGAPQHIKGDLVWVKIKRLPFWPAVVKNIYLERKRLKKISVKFIGEFAHVDPKRGYRLNYNKRTTVPFAESHSQHARLKEEGMESEQKEYFLEAVTKAEDFIRKKVLGLPLDSIEFFDDGASDIDVDSCEGNPLEPLSASYMEALDDFAEISPEEENEGDGVAPPSSEDEVDENAELTEAQKERKAKLKAKQEKLVEFIKTDATKNYLYAIYQGNMSSDLHNLYQTGGEARRRLRFNSSYGPIDDTDMEDEIFLTLKSYFQSLFHSKNYDVHYILDVWTPESIVYAIMKTTKYSRKRAWDIFHKGVRKTKVEREREHTELMMSAARIDDEAKARYDYSFEQSMKSVKTSLDFTE